MDQVEKSIANKNQTTQVKQNLAHQHNKMCHLSAMLVKATHFGPTGFLHYFLKYMELTNQGQDTLTKLNAQQLEKLGKYLQYNATITSMGGKGIANDNGLNTLLTENETKIKKFFFGKYDDLKMNDKKKIVESGDHITYYMIEYKGTIYISFHPKIWNKKKNTDNVTGFPRDYTSWVSNERWEGQFLNLANTLFKGTEREGQSGEKKYITTTSNDDILFRKKVDKTDNEKPHIVVGYQCSGPISEIVGIRLKTEFKKNDVTVVNWSSPSWFNTKWAQNHTITSKPTKKRFESLWNQWELAKNDKNFKLFKFRSVSDLFPEMPRFFNSAGLKYTKPTEAIKPNKCKDNTGEVQLKTAWKSNVSIVPGYKQLGDGTNGKLDINGYSLPQPVANEYTYFVKTANGKLTVKKVSGINEEINCNKRNRLNTFKLGFINIPNKNGSQMGLYYDQWKIREKIFKQIYNLEGLKKKPKEEQYYDINHNLTDQATHEFYGETLKKKTVDDPNLLKGKKIVLTVVPETKGGRRKTRKRRKRKVEEEKQEKINANLVVNLKKDAVELVAVKEDK